MPDLAAVVLPPAAGEGPEHLIRAIADQPSRFRMVILGPRGTVPVPGLEHRTVIPRLLPVRRARRYAAGVAAALHALRPAVIEVHDAPELAAWLGERFRPVPVVLVAHTGPQARRKAQDGAARTLLLALVTRVAALSSELRARLLEGVHPAMRHCALLPPPDGPGGPAATAAALDALRLDALRAWSRPLHGPI